MPMPKTDTNIEAAYQHCLALATSHYENFPVASWLLPKYLRRPIAVIYAFARTADDFADEGELAPGERIAKLDAYGAALEAIAAGEPATDPVFIALADVIARHALPLQLFQDLLTAFRMDVTTTRYADFDAVLHYCRHSANPVGRLLLHLSHQATPDNLRDADAVCTALQLINFWQDLAQDYQENRRIYLPQDDMARYGVTEQHLRDQISDTAMAALMAAQRQRTRSLMLSGAPLGTRLPGRLGWEIRLTIAGGLGVLDALARQQNLFSRPRLRRRDWLRLAGRALRLPQDTVPPPQERPTP